MSNAIIHKLIECGAQVAAYSTQLKGQMSEMAQQRVEQSTATTEEQASAIRKQGWTAVTASCLGLAGTLAATYWLERANLAKPIGAICSAGGNVFSSVYRAEETRLGGRAGLIQNHFLPESKQIAEKCHQHAQGFFSTLSQLQQQSGRSHVGAA